MDGIEQEIHKLALRSRDEFARQFRDAVQSICNDNIVARVAILMGDNYGIKGHGDEGYNRIADGDDVS